MISKKYSIMEHFFYPTVFFATILLLIVFASARGVSQREYLLGGESTVQDISQYTGHQTQTSSPESGGSERILRPSSQPELTLQFEYNAGGKGIPEVFNNPRELIEAYFSVLSKAENMGGCCSGCGATGWAQEPYPLAYKMLSKDLKKSMSFQKYVSSFLGIGNINLLKLYEMNKATINGKTYPRFFVEFETIEKSQDRKLTLFGYYSGELVLQNEGKEGWKIKQIGVSGEDFLCKAYHGEHTDALTAAKSSYQISSVYNIKQEGSLTELLGQSKGGRIYKLVFTKLTDGSAYLIRALVQNENGKWEESYIN